MSIKPKEFTILPIDFTKPWWHLAFQQKWLFLLVVLSVTCIQICWSLLPFVAAKLFDAQSFLLCSVVFAAWFMIDSATTMIRMRYNNIFQLQCIYSIYQNVYIHLIGIDPQYHVHRSSGSVIAKIERAARGYEDFLDHVTYEFTPLIIGLITVITTLAYYSLLLAGIMSLFVLMILSAGYYFTQYKCKIWESAFIETDDLFKASAAENLTQIQLIRSTFASPFRRDALKRDVDQDIKAESSLWFAYGTLFLTLGSLYTISLFVLACFLVWHIQNNLMSPAIALGLFLAYTQSSKEIVRFSRLLRKTMHSKTVIEDLFTFIRGFGKQNFPVFGPSMVHPSDAALSADRDISITADALSFDYGRASLFNDHAFMMTCTRHAPSKLYGIIGPSGSGKTTFLSILGGQLKPINGRVVINDIDIYTTNDATRSKLIALQGQVASTLRGTLKNSLLLGLPAHHGYTDQDLLDVLRQVGLLGVLKDHNGLDTMLGEGGLNISGGQRQRLNFAGLYLRARYFKPPIVLIDEPTSSLDDISEAAITDMIQELARHCATLVVAHRLKTIEKAVGIIDLSLLNQEKTITIYTPQKLYSHSAYYRGLMDGNVELNDTPDEVSE